MPIVCKARIEIIGIVDEEGDFHEQPKTTIDFPIKTTMDFEDLTENLMVYIAMGRRLLR